MVKNDRLSVLIRQHHLDVAMSLSILDGVKVRVRNDNFVHIVVYYIFLSHDI